MGQTHYFFFTNGRSELCSYVEDWTFQDYLLFNFKDFIIKCIVLYLRILKMCSNMCFDTFKDSILYKKILSVMDFGYGEFLSYICF